VEIFVFTVTIP